MRPWLCDTFGNVVFVAVSYTIDGSPHKKEDVEHSAVKYKGHDVERLEEGSYAGNFCPDPIQGENESDDNADKGQKSAHYTHQRVSEMVNKAKAADGFYSGHQYCPLQTVAFSADQGEFGETAKKKKAGQRKPDNQSTYGFGF
jgi:hypothetical protein